MGCFVRITAQSRLLLSLILTQLAFQNLMRMREQQHNQLMRQQPMMPGQVPLGVRRGGNGMVPPNLQKAALNNGLYAQPLAYLHATLF
jgi:hypothetical protein